MCLGAAPELEQNSPFSWVDRLGDVRFAHDGQITSILVLPDGKQILSSSRDGTIRQWDLDTGKEARRFVNDVGSDMSGPMVLSPDGKHLTARVGYLQIWRWDFKTGEVLNRLDVTLKDPAFPDGDVFLGTKLTVLPHGNKVLVGYGNEGKKGRCALWDIATGKKLQQWTFEENEGVEALRPLPDGQTAWIGVGRQAIKLDLVSGKQLMRVSFPPPRGLRQGEYKDRPNKQAYYHGLIRGMVLAEDGRTVLVSQSDRGCSLINADSGEILWNSKERFQLSRGKYDSNGPWVIGLDGIINVQTQEHKRLDSDDFAYAWNQDRSIRYGFKGNRIYGFDAKTNEQLFPTSYGRHMNSYVGIDRIYLLKDGKQALVRAGYPSSWWGFGTSKRKRFCRARCSRARGEKAAATGSSMCMNRRQHSSASHLTTGRFL